MILPSEGPSIPGRCNYDTLSPKFNRDAGAMDRGSADEVIVLIKPGAVEGVVTRLRRKLTASDKEVGGEGRNMYGDRISYRIY